MLRFTDLFREIREKFPHREIRLLWKYCRRPALCAVSVTTFLIAFVAGFTSPGIFTSSSAKRASTPEASWQAQIRELKQNLTNPHLLLLRGGAFDPVENEPEAIHIGQMQLETTNLAARSTRLNLASATQAAAGEQAYYIVQYDGRILPESTDNLRAGGYEIVGYLPNNAYIVKAPRTGPGQLQAARESGEVRWVGAYGAGLKVEPLLRQTVDEIANEAEAPEGAAQTIAVSFITFPGESSSAVRQVLKKQTANWSEPVIEDRQDGRAWGVFFVGRADAPRVVAALANLEGVEWIERRQPNRSLNDNGVKVVQSGIAGEDTPLYRHGLTGAGQIYGTADSGLDTDSAQFRLSGQSSAQTLSYAVTTQSLSGGLFPVSITNPDNKVLTYYLLGSGRLIENAANPNGGQTLDPGQRLDSYYINAVGYDDSLAGYHGTATTSVAVGRNYNADGSGGVPGIPLRTSGDGVAPDARVVFQDVGHPSGGLPGVDYVSQALIHQQAYSSGVRVHNNSYGPEPPVGYDENASDIDDIMWRLRDYNIFFAAGNGGYGTTKVTNAAKNNVVVAATDTPTNGGNVENIAYYSNHGPTLDGRLKPDIAAPGTVRAATESAGNNSIFGGATSSTAKDAAVNPTAPNNGHSMALTAGTSFSSPMVAGGALLVRQYFVDGYYPNGARGMGAGFNPSNALVKAIILNSGRNMPGRFTASNGASGASGPLPNFGQGWGRIALDDALYFTGDQRQLKVLADIYNGATTADSTRPATQAAITTGETHSYQIANVSAAEPLRITLVWSDPKAAIGSAVALVNNLNLEVIDPMGNVYRGNANFSNAYSQPANGAAFDELNPVEGVYIQAPLPGVYTVHVIGANVPGNGQMQVLSQPGNQRIDSNRQGYALITTGDVDAVPASSSTSVDAASYVRAAAPGQILAAFGTGFPAGTNLRSEAAGLPLPTQLDGVSIRVNGMLAPLYSAWVGGSLGAGAYQINYQLPYETGSGRIYVEVLNNGAPIASDVLTANTAAPGVFTVTASGRGQAAALNEDYSRNGDPGQTANARPEARGRHVIIYANGQGGQLVDPSTHQPLTIATGAPAPSNGQIYATAATPTVTIGGVQAIVDFSGLAPGYVGLWQLNVLIPDNAPTGSIVPVVVTFGERTSSATTIAIN
ncbi:MAG TPA: S8 family serine peptidase [Blastocatellia bacterium]|nr:S8 family serine peptidase [Blastocatellia bacterium]